MPEGRGPAAALMRWICRLYPRDFRALFGADMVELFVAEHRRARVARGRLGATLWALRTLTATFLAALRERLRSRGAPRELRASRAFPAHRSADPRRRSPVMEKAILTLIRAARRLLRAPGFTFAATLTLALGIGASTAIFALVDGVLLRPLPYPQADRLVSIQHTAPGLDLPRVGQSTGTYLQYRRRSDSFQEVGLYHRATGNLTGDGRPERLSLGLVTPSLLSTLGVDPAVGRPFAAADAEPGAASVVLLSHALWTGRYGGDPGLLGRTIEINDRPREVVGIMPADFAFPSPETDVWFVLPTPPAEARFGGLYLEAVGRLRPGVTPSRATAELRGMIPSFADAFDDVTAGTLASIGLDVRVVPLKSAVLGDVDRSLWILLGTVLGVLLIACVNVANLFLVRAERGQKEVAIRSALGAGAGDLLRHWLGESLLLTLAGGAAGVALAHVAVGSLVASSPADLPRIHEVALDGRVLACAATATLLAALGFGLLPVLRSGGARMVGTLRGGTRGATAGVARQRTRRLLVAGQMAVALVLLVGSALMVRSYWNLARVDPGFRSDDLLTFRLGLPFNGYESYDDARSFYDGLLARIRALPGVQAAAAVSQLPLAGAGLFQDPLGTAADPPDPDEVPPVVSFVRTTPGYLETLGIPVRQGRRFRPDDAERDAPAALLSESLARRLFPGRSPLGERIRRHGEAESPWHTVVGVVGDVRDTVIHAPPGEIVYLPVLEQPAEPHFIPRAMTVVVRASVPPETLAAPVRAAVAEIDPDVPLAAVRPLSDIVADSTASSRFTMVLLLIAGAAALFLGAVGLYGVVSYTVSQRTREIGVRIALGARAGDVGGMVLREAVLTAGAGLLLGTLAALGLARLLDSLLYEVSVTDPTSFAAMAAVLLVVALVATWLPARRAARVDPVEALGAE